MRRVLWRLRNSIGSHPVPAANLYDMEVAGSAESQHTHDVHTNARELRLGLQSGGKARSSRLEHMGNLPCDRCVAGYNSRYGNLIRDQGPTKGQERKQQ